MADYAPIVAHLERVPLPLGETLYVPGSQMQRVYFPTTAVLSLHYVTRSGASAECAGVGREGVIGMSMFMGGGSTSSSAVVNTAGHAYRLATGVLRQEFDRGQTLQHLLLRHTQALITRIAQTAACNRHHTVEQQPSRWLLLTSDRASSGELVTTQELVAGVLGVRRESITETAGRLQARGLHPRPAWPHHDARPRRAATVRLQVLRRGSRRAGPFAAQRHAAPHHAAVC